VSGSIGLLGRCCTLATLVAIRPAEPAFSLGATQAVKLYRSCLYRVPPGRKDRNRELLTQLLCGLLRKFYRSSVTQTEMAVFSGTRKETQASAASRFRVGRARTRPTR
jgi:hypothetical protein